MLDWLRPTEPPHFTEDDNTLVLPGQGARLYRSPTESFNASHLRFSVVVQYMLGLWASGSYGGACHFDNVTPDTWTSRELENLLPLIQSGTIWRSETVDKLIVEEILPDAMAYFEVMRNEGKISNIVNFLIGNGTNGVHFGRGEYYEVVADPDDRDIMIDHDLLTLMRFLQHTSLVHPNWSGSKVVGWNLADMNGPNDLLRMLIKIPTRLVLIADIRTGAVDSLIWEKVSDRFLGDAIQTVPKTSRHPAHMGDSGYHIRD